MSFKHRQATRFSLATALFFVSLICLLLAMFRVLTVQLVLVLGLTFLGLFFVAIYGVVGGIAVLQLARIVLDKIQHQIDKADDVGSREDRQEVV